MPAGKGTYGSKVGRPSKKKKLKKAQAGTTVKGTKGMTYGLGKGYGKFAKAMTKAGKAANAGKTLKKAQPGNIVGAAPPVGSAYDSALRALGLGKDELEKRGFRGKGKGAAGAGAITFAKFASKVGKAALTAKEGQQLQKFGLANPDKFPPIPPPPPLLKKEKKGGSVINAKALRNNSRGKARKNK